MIEQINIKIDKGAYMPTRAHEEDAGFDLYSPIDIVVPRCAAKANIVSISNFHADITADIGSAIIDTGVHIEIPRGYVGFIKSKSGLNVKHGLTSEGVIDSGYVGSIVVKLYNHTAKDYEIKAGHRIAQLVLLPIITPKLNIVEELAETDRGCGGFGSTGV